MPAELAAEKRRLRRSLSERRRAVGPEQAGRAASRIADRLLAEPAVRRARRIALYAALPDEIPSRPIFDALAALRVQRLLPRVQGEDALVFALVEDWGELRPGRYGVLEPPARAAGIPLEEEDCVLVPGVAFDRAGNRLGRGRGFYDRAFPAAASRAPLLIGVAYELQLVARVPHGDADRRMDAVVTEQGLYRTRRMAE